MEPCAVSAREILVLKSAAAAQTIVYDECTHVCYSNVSTAMRRAAGGCVYPALARRDRRPHVSRPMLHVPLGASCRHNKPLPAQPLDTGVWAGGGNGVVVPVVLVGALAQAEQAGASGASSAARAGDGGGAPTPDGPGGGAQSATSRSSATHHHQSTAASARAARPTRPGASSRPKYAHREDVQLTLFRASSERYACAGAVDGTRRGSARAATRQLWRSSRRRTTAPEHYFGSDAPHRCCRPPVVCCQFYAKLRAGGEAICTLRVRNVPIALVTLYATPINRVHDESEGPLSLRDR
ncbi:unnamed protein product [Colias eurytheme]|nr:unnamed protein product [Colias eurytheme]